MYGCYLVCDKCGISTIDGVSVTRGKGNAVQPLGRHQGEELRELAASHGWKLVGEKDVCPTCAKEDQASQH